MISMLHNTDISIHAPREGSDQVPPLPGVPVDRFLSTLPARGATLVVLVAAVDADISIHAPREGSDDKLVGAVPCVVYFYPRSPRGERPLTAAHTGCRSEQFLSTLPARGATQTRPGSCSAAQFLSTLPARGATKEASRQKRGQEISIHTPREGSDCIAGQCGRCGRGFLSTLPARGATRPASGNSLWTRYFYPHSPRGERPPHALGVQGR